MNSELLVNLGLTPPQAETYLALVEHGQSTAPQIAQAAGQTRTNAYSLLDKLAEIGLAERVEGAKKVTYRALGPSAIERLVTEQRQAAQKREELLQSNLPALMTFFHNHSEQPAVRFFQGKAEIRRIYEDQIATGQDILIVRSPDDIRFYDYEFMSRIRHASRQAGLQRHSIEPDFNREGQRRATHSDKYMLLERTWVQEGGYTAPVEWGIYGNKVSIISFGQEAIGMIIESPQIAESLRQLYGLLETGLRRQPNYDQLPRHRTTMHPDDAARFSSQS